MSQELTRDEIMSIMDYSAYYRQELRQELSEISNSDLEHGKKALRLYFHEPISSYKFKKYDVKHIDFKTVFYKDNSIFVNIKSCGTGYMLGQIIEDYHNIEDFEIIDVISNRRKYTFRDVQKRLYDSMTWSNLEEKDFIGEYKEDIRFVSINTNEKFRAWIPQIEKAFNEKTEFSFHRNGIKRDLSVNGRLVDGIYQAWYSSEYAGCGNGDYYLLLNPTTAVFMEHD